MVLNKVFVAAGCALVLAWSGPSVADDYRPDEFLSLDLSRAVLSPKPLGPTAGFVPGPLDVSVDPRNHSAQAFAESTAEPKAEGKAEPRFAVRATRVSHIPTPRLARQQAAPPRMVARTKFVRHHRSPLDAQAFDARIQVWPCKSGGICNWKR